MHMHMAGPMTGRQTRLKHGSAGRTGTGVAMFMRCSYLPRTVTLTDFYFHWPGGGRRVALAAKWPSAEACDCESVLAVVPPPHQDRSISADR